MEKTKNTFIKNIEALRNGVRSQDGFDVPWTMWKITDIDGDRYIDFDHVERQLEPAMDAGQEVKLIFDEEPSGKMNKEGTKELMNRSIKRVEVPKVIPDEFIARLKKVEDILRAQGHQL